MENSYVRKKNNNDVKPSNEIRLFEHSNVPHQNYQHKEQFPKADRNTLDRQRQLLVKQYLLKATGLSKSQLIKDREDLFQELHQISKYLNQIIPILSPNINQNSPSSIKSKYVNSKNSPNHLKSQLNNPSQNQLSQFKYQRNHQNNEHTQSPKQSNANKKYSKPQAQLTPSNIKTYLKDDLQSLTLNEMDSLSENNLKLIISLEQEIQDYEFMLTPQYSQKLSNQIQNQRQHKKQLLQQISSFNKIIEKQNRDYDQQAISQLEKYSYDKQMELNLLTKKLNFKLNKLSSIQSQNKSKLTKIDSLSKQQHQLSQILQMYEDGDQQGPQQSRRKEDIYSKLISKKEKIDKMINSMNSNKLKDYNRKLSDFRLLQQQIQDYEQLTKLTQNNILTLLDEQRNFHQQYKHIIKKLKITPNHETSSSKQIPFEHSKSSPIRHVVNTRQKPPNRHSIREENSHLFQKTSSLLYKKKLKNFSQHSNSRNQHINQMQSSDHFQHKNENQTFNNEQNPLLQQPQHVKRRRIYTELENNHYFTSLERNQSKQQNFQPKDSKEINFPMNFVHNQVLLTRKQRKLNSSASSKVRVGDLTKVKTFTNKNRQNQESIEKDVAYQDMIEVEKRLRKLEQFLGKEEINLAALKKMENRFSLQNSNRKLKLQNHEMQENMKNTSFDGAYDSEPFQMSSERREPKMNIKQRHYKELCQRLGKNKLLIEEDEDIRGLIYQGIFGSESK